MNNFSYERIKPYLSHIGFWVVFYFCIQSLEYHNYEFFNIVYVFRFLVNVTFFYYFFNLFKKIFENDDRIKKHIWSVVIGIVMYFVLIFMVKFYLGLSSSKISEHQIKSYSASTIYMIVKYMALSFVFAKYVDLNIKQERIKAKLAKKDKLVTVYLSHQSSQHFIYNSLNMLFSMANKDSEKVSARIISLAETLRKHLIKSKI